LHYKDIRCILRNETNETNKVKQLYIKSMLLAARNFASEQAVSMSSLAVLPTAASAVNYNKKLRKTLRFAQGPAQLLDGRN